MTTEERLLIDALQSVLDEGGTVMDSDDLANARAEGYELLKKLDAAPQAPVTVGLLVKAKTEREALNSLFCMLQSLESDGLRSFVSGGGWAEVHLSPNDDYEPMADAWLDRQKSQRA